MVVGTPIHSRARDILPLRPLPVLAAQVRCTGTTGTTCFIKLRPADWHQRSRPESTAKGILCAYVFLSAYFCTCTCVCVSMYACARAYVCQCRVHVRMCVDVDCACAVTDSHPPPPLLHTLTLLPLSCILSVFLAYSELAKVATQAQEDICVCVCVRVCVCVCVCIRYGHKYIGI